MASSRLTTRIAKELHRRIKVQAALTGRSIEEIVEEALRMWLEDAETLAEEVGEA